MASELKNLTPELWIALAKQLVDTHIFECNQLAFELLGKNTTPGWRQGFEKKCIQNWKPGKKTDKVYSQAQAWIQSTIWLSISYFR